jgi:hypothetical protein
VAETKQQKQPRISYQLDPNESLIVGGPRLHLEPAELKKSEKKIAFTKI